MSEASPSLRGRLRRWSGAALGAASVVAMLLAACGGGGTAATPSASVEPTAPAITASAADALGTRGVGAVLGSAELDALVACLEASGLTVEEGVETLPELLDDGADPVMRDQLSACAEEQGLALPPAGGPGGELGAGPPDELRQCLEEAGVAVSAAEGAATAQTMPAFDRSDPEVEAALAECGFAPPGGTGVP